MGLKPNDPGYLEESRQPMLYAVSYSMLGLATVVLALRAYCRLFLVRVVQVFDYVMLVAFVDIVVMHAMIHMQIKTGMGRHIEFSEMHPQMHEESKKVGYVQNICYQSALGFIKSSILLQYLSIASGARLQRWVIKGLLAFVILLSLLTTISAILLCIPVTNTWDAEKFPMGCWNTATFNFITSGINTATDIVIYLLPLPVLLRLKMNRRKKYALIAIFCLAFIAVGASLGRLSSLIAWDNSGDITYDAATIPIWDAVETDVAVAAISLPLLRPLFKRSADYGPTLSSISSRIMRNWSFHARGSSSHFSAGNGDAFGGGSIPAAAVARRGAAATTTTTSPSTIFPMGRRTSSSDDLTASSMEMASGGDYGRRAGERWKGRTRSDKDGCRVMAEEYEIQPFGEVLVTRTVMVDAGREIDDKKPGDIV